MSLNHTTSDQGFRITGWHVLGSLLAFFGAVMVVNVVMVWAALSTFGGVETSSSYKAGLEFTDEMERAAAQRGLGWTVNAELAGNAAQRIVSVDATDATGNSVAGLAAEATFAHPADERQDRQVILFETAPGRYEGDTDVPDGVWSLRLAFSQDGEVLYRSRNRVTLR